MFVETQLTATLKRNSGCDMTVVNEARQSFGKSKDEALPLDMTDKGLLQYLAVGMRGGDLNSFLLDIANLSQEVLDCDRYSLLTTFSLFTIPASPAEYAAWAAKLALFDRLMEFKRQAVHFAPFTHPQLSIALEMPIFLARQYGKHSVGGHGQWEDVAWSEESRRYIGEDPTFFVEPVLHERPDDIKQGAGRPVEDQALAWHQYRKATTQGLHYYKSLRALGVAPEEAREVLPQNMMTGITWTGSLLFWSRVVTLRADAHAQGAAQRLARQIDAIIRPLYPHSWPLLVGKLKGLENEPQTN